MAKHRTHSIEFKRQVAQEFLSATACRRDARAPRSGRALAAAQVLILGPGALHLVPEVEGHAPVLVGIGQPHHLD